MAKKIDLSGVKEFMFHHGEKVALGTCVFLALFLGTLGLLRALSANRAESGRTYADELTSKVSEISGKVASAQPAVLPKEIEQSLLPEAYVWDPITSRFVPQKLINAGDVDLNKRGNPRVFAIKNDPKPGARPQMQLDYMRSLVLMHKVHQGEANYVDGLLPAGAVDVAPMKLPKGQPAPPVNLPPFLRTAAPLRFVVGTAIFPMKDQVEEFRRALKLTSQKQLFDNPADLPLPKGFNLVKVEWLNGKPAKNPEILMSYENGALTVAPRLKEVLGTAFFDEKVTESMFEYVFAGLTMPMPKLAYGEYPKFMLDGIDIEWPEPLVEGKKDGMPPAKERPILPFEKKFKKPMPLPENDPKMAGAERVVKKISKKDLETADLELAQRLFAKDFNIFHVFGMYPPKEDAPAPVVQKPGRGMPKGVAPAKGATFTAWGGWPVGGLPEPKQPPVPPKAGAAPAEAPFPNWNRDAVVRFIDVDVEPGKTYRYGIQIRLANPNYEKKEEVAFDSLAAIPELVSEWEYTPTITIPDEYFLYAVDQQLLDDMAADRKSFPADPKLKDTTTFQIHEWMKIKNDQKNHEKYFIGDWAIAERIVARRGDEIGVQATVQVPVWRELKDSFEVPLNRNPKDKGFAKPGLQIDLIPPQLDNKAGKARAPSYPVLIDFIGGKRKVGTGMLEEETAVDALILGPDGKLRVLNSRIAADLTNELDWIRLEAEDRHIRVKNSRQRVHDELKAATGGPNSKGSGPGGSGN